MARQRLHDGRFTRIERLVGQEGFARLANAFVCVVGLGAVGSYATEALARAGIGRLRLVDFDEVRLSNINRQLYALNSTVGMKKCQIARQRVLEINPNCQLETMETFVHRETVDEVLNGKPDIVIDAIDSFTPKLILLEAVQAKGIRLISSMGAALRTDPLSVRVGLMHEVHTCSLAARLRKALRKKQVPLEFTCVYSVEPARTPFEETSDDDVPARNEETLARGRTRQTLGSLPTLTGIFGLTAANVAISALAGIAARPDRPPVISAKRNAVNANRASCR
jgi:tRNA threonylcarbamoyladenosine dehydratase